MLRMRSYLAGMAIILACTGISQAQNLQPLHNTEELDMDYDWFRPLYREDFMDGRPPRTGMYFTYERLYMNISRRHEANERLSYEIQRPYVRTDSFGTPVLYGGGRAHGNLRTDEITNFRGDWTYGNRFEIGYMGDKDTGWFFTAMKINNPRKRLVEDNIRRNENAPDADGDGDVEFEIIEWDIISIQQQLDLPVVQIEVGQRAFSVDLLNEPIGETYITLNGLNYYSFDLNKIWRLKPFHNGMVVEPFVGPRYTRIRDHSDRADFVRDPAVLIVPVDPAAVIADVFADYDAYVQNLVYTDNDMYGGQFGFRTQLRRGRWLVNSEVRGFLMNNFRSREHLTTAEISAQRYTVVAVDGVAGIGVDGVPQGQNISFRQDLKYDESEVFTYGGELKVNASFELTNYFSLNGGLQILAFGDGVGRGVTGTDEAFTAGGVTFGFLLNR